MYATKAIAFSPVTPERTSSSRRRSPALNRFGSPPHQRSSQGRQPAPPPTPPELYTFAFTPTLPSYLGALEYEEEDAGRFDYTAMARALEEIERGMARSSGRLVVRREDSHYVETAVRAGKRDKVSSRYRKAYIMRLPNEVLILIFQQLHDQHGFPSRPSPAGPDWYTPPLKIALVCRRWLPLARQLFYRTISIHHTGRIESLARTLSNPDVGPLVRRISIKLPATVRQITADDMAIEGKNATKTHFDALRLIFQSCPGLLRIEISSKSSPASLFLPYISPTPEFATSHLHHLSLQSVTTLVLSCSFPQDVGEGITSEDLRGALLGLTGLKQLSITGYTPTNTPLEFGTRKTRNSLSGIRSLPLRARRLHLIRLDLLECSFPPSDLSALLSHIVPGSLKHLTITEVHHRGTQEPTITGLPTLAPLLSSLRSLRISLYNHEESMPILDSILPHLTNLEILDIGGTICSGPAVLSLLPPSLRTLRLRVLPSLPPTALRSFLQQVAARRARFGGGGERETRQGTGSSRQEAQWEAWPQLRRIDVWGGESLEWKAGQAAWEVQKACWDAGVVWGR